MTSYSKLHLAIFAGIMMSGCSTIEIVREEHDTKEKEIEFYTGIEVDEAVVIEDDSYWSDYDNYDYYAYELTTRTDGERNGNPEYIYSGSLAHGNKEEWYEFKNSELRYKEDNYIKIWRYDFDFTPESRMIIMVKYPKGERNEILDIMIVHTPTGEFFWNNIRK